MQRQIWPLKEVDFRLCVGESFFFLSVSFFSSTSFFSTPTSLYVIIVGLEWKPPSVLESRHCTINPRMRYKQRLFLALAAYHHFCDVRRMSLYVFVFSVNNKGAHSFLPFLPLCLRKIEGYGLVEMCHLFLSFDGPCLTGFRWTLSAGPCVERAQTWSPFLPLSNSAVSPCQKPPKAFAISTNPLFILYS